MITKEKITGVIGATIFMILLLIILLFSYFTIANPSDEMGGIPVMFGNMEEAGGYEEPPIDEIAPKEAPIQKNTPNETPLIAQNEDFSIAVEEEKKKEEQRKKEEAEERRRREAAERKKREEEAKQRIRNQISGIFGKVENANRGEVEGAGTQGVSTGSSNEGATFGKGAIGFSLEGRSVGRGGLVKPNYTVDQEGKVVVQITVDPKGNVIRAEQGKGTFAPSELVNEAIKAARRTKFNTINSTNPQEGTITYNFKLN